MSPVPYLARSFGELVHNMLDWRLQTTTTDPVADVASTVMPRSERLKFLMNALRLHGAHRMMPAAAPEIAHVEQTTFLTRSAR